MNPSLKQLPLDLTGTRLENLRVAEYHDIQALTGLPYRPFVLNYGSFFSEGFQLRDSTGRELVLHQDFQFSALHAEATARAGKEVYSLVVVTNPNVTHLLYATAQMVGGDYVQVTDAILKAAQALLLDNRAVDWKNLTGRPATLPGSGHFHAIWEIYGFEGLCHELDRLIQAGYTRSQHYVDLLTQEMRAALDAIIAERAEAYLRVEAHKADTQNPHRTTKAHVGLGLLANHPPATEDDALVIGRGYPDNMTSPLRTAQHIAVNFGSMLDTHQTDQGNPHRLKPEQLNGRNTAWVLDRIRDKKTPLNATVNSSRLFMGKTYAQLSQEARSDLDASEIKSERIYQLNLGTAGGSASNPGILTGARTYRGIKDILQDYDTDSPRQTVFVNTQNRSLANAKAYIESTYGDITKWPAGSVFIFTYLYEQGNYTRSSDVHGNGTYYTQVTFLAYMVRTTSGWFSPF